MAWTSRPGGARTSGSHGAARPLGSVRGAPGPCSWRTGCRGPCARTVGSWLTFPCVPNFGERNCEISHFVKSLSLCHSRLSLHLNVPPAVSQRGEENRMCPRAAAAGRRERAQLKIRSPRLQAGSFLPRHRKGGLHGHEHSKPRRSRAGVLCSWTLLSEPGSQVPRFGHQNTLKPPEHPHQA